MLGLYYTLHRKLVGMIPLRLKKWLLARRWVWHLRYGSRYIDLYIRRRTPVIIYQMGKVGSSSTYHALLSLGFFTLHCHFLVAERISKNLEHPPYQDYMPYRMQFLHWLWIHDHIVAPGRPAKFITLVRDPIANTIASYFEGRIDRFSDESQRMTVEEVQQAFDAERDAILEDRLTWFDREMKQALGIDVYATPFDKERGYARYQQGNFEVLLLKLEMDDAIKERAIAEFLGLETFQLAHANIGEEKMYADLYRRFKQDVIIPADALEMAYSSQFVRHFYTDSEIAMFRSRWERNRDVSEA